MTEPDDGRPGDPATPPPADPAPPAADDGPEAKGPEAKGDETAGALPPTVAPQAAPPDPAPIPAPVPAATTAAAAPEPPRAEAAAPPRPAAPERKASADDEADDYDDDYDDYGAPRWVSLTTGVGASIVGVVALQVVLALVEGFSLKKGQRFDVPDDLLHRIGYPFGALGSTAMFFVVLAVILLALPAILGEEVTDRQYAIIGATLKSVIAIGVLVGLGSLLAVRGSLHEYSAKDVAVPGFVRVQFTSFLLATLATSALAVFGALAALRLRHES